MEFLKVLVLSVVQGVAEFLPISSSGHLVAAKTLMSLDSPGVTLELALHAGTLLSICIFYYGMLRGLVLDVFGGKRAAWRYAWAILVSMVPAGVAYALLGDWLEEAFSKVSFVGPAWLATGLMLLTTRREAATVAESSAAEKAQLEMSIWNALWMGLGQVVAMLPGVSRSGTTIWVARACRVPSDEAVRFSFLMSVPVIGGACALKLLKLVMAEPSESAEVAGVPAWMLVVGGLVAAVVGYVSLRILVRMLHRGMFWVFGVYCILAGIVLMCVA